MNENVGEKCEKCEKSRKTTQSYYVVLLTNAIPLASSKRNEGEWMLFGNIFVRKVFRIELIGVFAPEVLSLFNHVKMDQMNEAQQFGIERKIFSKKNIPDAMKISTT